MDDLQRELPSPQLAKLRIARPCKESWADMVGDDRVRHCAGCDRKVFNLSAMTREEAESLLATRGVKPCVRFYRRADGTVMTADCPTGAPRPVRRLAVVAAGTALLGSSVAGAEPAVPAPADAPATATPATTSAAPVPQVEEPLMGEIYIAPSPPHPAIEWSTWLRGAIGVAAQDPMVVARGTMPVVPEQSSIGEGALGADLSLSLALHGNFRVGAFTEVRTTSGPVVGGELIVAGLPPRPYGSSFDGSGAFVLRAGANSHVVTTALGFGYRGWPRGEPLVPFARHAVDIRFVASMNRSLDNPRDWSATLGIELDPIGAFTYIVKVVSH